VGIVGFHFFILLTEHTKGQKRESEQKYSIHSIACPVVADNANEHKMDIPPSTVLTAEA
jgi:hypothetical protein